MRIGLTALLGVVAIGCSTLALSAAPAVVTAEPSAAPAQLVQGYYYRGDDYDFYRQACSYRYYYAC